MKKTVLIARKIVINNLGEAFRKLTGCDFVNAGNCNYTKITDSYSNIITWGMKLPWKWYKSKKGKNFLFIENGLLSQKNGMYIDHSGWFGDSSICKEPQPEPTNEEITALENKVKEIWDKELYQYEGSSGPILFAAQMKRDMGPKHYFNGKFYDVFPLLHSDYRNENLVIRKHPRERLNRERIKMSDKWCFDKSSGNIYDRLKDFSKVVSINSTLLIESAVLGLPVHSYGRHVYDGFNLSDKADRTRFLCAVLRHHIPYKSGVSVIENSESFQIWNAKRLKS